MFRCGHKLFRTESECVDYAKECAGYGMPVSYKEITMIDILRALESEIGQKAFDIYEWYCKTYRVDGADIAPDSIVYEVY